MKVICKTCGAENSRDARYCCQCTTALFDELVAARKALEDSVKDFPGLTDPNLPAVITQLGRVRTQDPTEVLMTFLRAGGGDRDELYRVCVADALGGVGTRKAYEALASMREDPNWAVRKVVMTALGRTGQPEGFAHLVQGLADCNPAVVSDAAMALTTIDYVGAVASERVLLQDVRDLCTYVRDIKIEGLSTDAEALLDKVLPCVVGALRRIIQGNPEVETELRDYITDGLRQRQTDARLDTKLISAACSHFPALLPILSEAGVIPVETGGYQGAVESLLRTIQARHPGTYEHSLEVARYSKAIGSELRRSPSEVDHLYSGGLLHDVGKIGVPDRVLTWPAGLTPEEFERYFRPHPTDGERILKPLGGTIEPLMALQHHERFDGTGYPSKLRRQQISLWGRIAAVADAVSAMLDSREYRAAKTTEWVIAQLVQGAEKQFDPEIADAFITAIAKGRLTLP